MTGSLLAIGIIPVVKSPIANNALSVGGLVLLIVPLFLLTKDSVFPAWNALYPCAGAALLLYTGGTSATLARRVLGWQPVAKFGLISYSLYLVHWPVIVFANYQLMREASAAEKAAMAAIMILLAWLSWRFVERPFRDRRRFSRRSIFTLSAIAGMAACAAGAALFLLDGLPQRFPGQALLAKRDNAQTKQQATCFLVGKWETWEREKCVIVPGDGGRTVLFWGDSHANQYVPSLKERRNSISSRVLLYASAGCAPLLDVDQKGRPDCRENNRHALEVIKEFGVRKVVLSAYWERIFRNNGLEASAIAPTVRRLQAAGVEVAIIGDNPDFPFGNPNYLAMRLAKRNKPLDPYYTTIRNSRSFNDMFERTAGANQFFNPMNRLCRGTSCLVYHGGEVMMWDNAHLSTYGASFVLDTMPTPFD